MNDCPLCTSKLLRHVGKEGVYWFCLHCRQTIPLLKQPPSQSQLNSDQNNL